MKWCFVLLALISVSFQSAGGRPVTAGEIKGRLFKRYFSQCLTKPHSKPFSVCQTLSSEKTVYREQYREGLSKDYKGTCLLDMTIVIRGDWL